MQLSVPIYVLKRTARQLARAQSLPLNEALDRVAIGQGYGSWSLLAARHAAQSPAARLFTRLKPGEIALVGARPGQGKTLFALEIAAIAANAGRKAYFFSFECTSEEVDELLGSIGYNIVQLGERFEFDGSDHISAEFITGRIGHAEKGTVVVIDYLQSLDHRRSNPALSEQIMALRKFAALKGLVMLFIAQIDRRYNPEIKALPDLNDVRMPNSIDLSVFAKSIFLNNGEVKIHIPEQSGAMAQ